MIEKKLPKSQYRAMTKEEIIKEQIKEAREIAQEADGNWWGIGGSVLIDVIVSLLEIIEEREAMGNSEINFLESSKKVKDTLSDLSKIFGEND